MLPSTETRERRAWARPGGVTIEGGFREARRATGDSVDPNLGARVITARSAPGGVPSGRPGRSAFAVDVAGPASSLAKRLIESLLGRETRIVGLVPDMTFPM